MIDKKSRIYIAGHRGMVGSAILRLLQEKGYENLIYRTSQELNLIDQRAVEKFFKEEKPDYVFLAAAKVGGINANNIYRAEFLYDNLMIQSNVINSAYVNNVKKLLFLGSSCIYPKFAEQPIKEDSLLTGTLEPTNEPYAIAKIAGIKLCETYRDQYSADFISAMPTNLYGPNDNYNLNNSHVLPALIRKFHTSKVKDLPSTEIWGTGQPLREFLHVDDLAAASLFLMENYSDSKTINVGYGSDLSIKELAYMIKDIVDYKGEITFNTDKPDGTPKKLMDSSRLRSLGWSPTINLEDGIKATYMEVDKSEW